MLRLSQASVIIQPMDIGIELSLVPNRSQHSNRSTDRFYRISCFSIPVLQTNAAVDV